MGRTSSYKGWLGLPDIGEEYVPKALYEYNLKEYPPITFIRL